MQLPKEIKVGGLTYTVEVDQALCEVAGFAGVISYGSCVITLGAAPPLAPGRIREALVYEVLHAICDCYNGDQSADEDQAIDHPTLDRLAHGIYQVMRDNPEFVSAVTAVTADDNILRGPTV